MNAEKHQAGCDPRESEASVPPGRVGPQNHSRQEARAAHIDRGDPNPTKINYY